MEHKNEYYKRYKPKISIRYVFFSSFPQKPYHILFTTKICGKKCTNMLVLEIIQHFFMYFENIIVITVLWQSRNKKNWKILSDFEKTLTTSTLTIIFFYVENWNKRENWQTCLFLGKYFDMNYFFDFFLYKTDYYYYRFLLRTIWSYFEIWEESVHSPPTTGPRFLI